MKKLIIPVFLLILFGCAQDNFLPEEGNIYRRSDIESVVPDNVYGNWIVVSFVNNETGTTIVKGDVDTWGGLDVEIRFMNDSTFCGVNTTNSVCGHYTMSDSLLNIDVYGGTKVGQPEWGNMFSDVVYSISSFRRSKTELRIYYDNGKRYIELAPLRREVPCAWTYSK